MSVAVSVLVTVSGPMHLHRRHTTPIISYSIVPACGCVGAGTLCPLPPRKRSVFGQGTRPGPAPARLGAHHISRASKLRASAFRTHDTTKWLLLLLLLALPANWLLLRRGGPRRLCARDGSCRRKSSGYSRYLPRVCANWRGQL